MSFMLLFSPYCCAPTQPELDFTLCLFFLCCYFSCVCLCLFYAIYLYSISLNTIICLFPNVYTAVFALLLHSYPDLLGFYPLFIFPLLLLFTFSSLFVFIFSVLYNYIFMFYHFYSFLLHFYSRWLSYSPLF